MNEKEEKNKRIRQIMDNLYDINMLDIIAEGDEFDYIYCELDEKYLIDIDPEDSSPFSDDDDVVEAIKPNIIEWFGENFGLGFKDGEYYFLSFAAKINDMKYWYVSRMKVNNLETAKKVGKLFELLEDM